MIGVFLLPVALAQPPLPLHAASEPCVDRLFPALAGEWVLACDTRRRIAKAVHLTSRISIDIPPTHRVAIGENRIHIPGHGYLRLGIDQQISTESSIGTNKTWPSLFHNIIATIQQDGTLQWADESTGETLSITSPMGRWGSIPAITAQGIAWISAGNDGDTDLWWTPIDAAIPRPIDVGPTPQRHVQASGDWIAWTSGDTIKMWNTRTDERDSIEAKTGFNAPISLWEDVVCWEERGPNDIDIHCSDGEMIIREGHQTHPHRWNQWLMFRENDQVMLKKLGDHE
ncbi:MAG: hypothetical protein ACPGTU_05450 [Myxococcota bacterium]